MKNSHLIIGLILCFSSLCKGQYFLQQFNLYSNANQIDSQYLLINKYETIFRKAQRWDSLIYLLDKKARLFHRTKGMKEALQVFIEGIDIVNNHDLQYTEPHLNLLLGKSRTIMDLGNYSKTHDILDLIIKQLYDNDTIGILELAMINKAYAYLNQNKINEAYEMAKSTENYSRNNKKDTVALLQTLGILAYIHGYRNELEPALKYAKKMYSISLTQYNVNHPNIGIALNNLADAHYNMGEYDVALDSYKASIECLFTDYKKNLQGRYLSLPIQNLGRLYTELGEYHLAQDQFKMGLELALMDYSKYNLALLWEYRALTENSILLEDYKAAQCYVDIAYEILNKNEESTQADFVYNQAYQIDIDLYSDLYEKSLTSALYLYTKDLKDNNPLVGISLSENISTNYFKLNKLSKSLEWALNTQLLSNEYYTSYHPYITANLVDLLEIYIALNDTKNIQDIQQKIYFNNTLKSKSPTLKNCLPNKYIVEFAAIWSKYLMSEIEKNRKDKSVYFDFLDDFEYYYNIHLSTSRSNTNVAKSTDLIKSIFRPAILLSLDTNPLKSLFYIEKVKNFGMRMNLQSQILQTDSSYIGQDFESHLLSLQDSNKIENFVNANYALENFKKRKDSLYKYDTKSYQKQFGFNTNKIEDISSILKPDECLLEYISIDTILYIIAYEGKNTHVKKRSKNTIDSLLELHINGTNSRQSHLLFSLLIPEELRDHKNILVIPDGKLNHLNFEELLDKNNNYLIQNYTFRYAYSASILYYQSILSNQKRSLYNILAFSPGFTSEFKSMKTTETKVDSSWNYFLQQPFLVNLANQLSSYQNSKAYVLNGATESKYKQDAHKYKIIHLGTHGLLNNESPMFSKLILAKDKNNDGYLHTYEIYAQNLNADLAVLSACNTGNGALKNGEALASMSHAFTHAGCPSVLLTLWEVDEKSTASILNGFYRYLMEGQNKSSALKQAKLDFIQNSPKIMQDPYYWAGLVLIGDDSPIFNRSLMSFVDWKIWSFIALIVLLLIGYIIFKWRSTSNKIINSKSL